MVNCLDCVFFAGSTIGFITIFPTTIWEKIFSELLPNIKQSQIQGDGESTTNFLKYKIPRNSRPPGLMNTIGFSIMAGHSILFSV